MHEAEAKKRGIDLEALKREQLRLSKNVIKKDYMDFSVVQLIAGIGEIVNEKTKEILIGMVVLDVRTLEQIESKFYKDKLNFPYIPGYRAYRELKPLLSCYEKLENRPDVFFIKAHGTSHPRQFGLACHFGIAADVCVVGIAEEPLKDAQIEGDEIKLQGKTIGKLVKLVEWAKPVVVSIGNKISLKTAVELAKKYGLGKYKLPYPLVAATRLVRKMAKEIF